MARTPDNAVNYMRKYSYKKVNRLPISGWAVKNSCLQAVKEAWGVTGTLVDPNHAWKQIPSDHKFTDHSTAPVGACHYWQTSGNGHIALQDYRNGYVWSTDQPLDNLIGLVTGWYVKHKWSNQVYLGWSDYLGPHKLPLAKDKDGNFIPAAG